MSEDMTTIQKLEAVRIELITLIARLSQPYRSNVSTCLEYLGDASARLVELEAKDQSTGVEIRIFLEDHHEAEAIQRVISNAEAEGEIDFGFVFEIRD